MADISPINYAGLQSQLDLRPLQQGLAIRDNRMQETEARQERQAVRQLATRKFETDQKEDAAYLQAVEAYKTNPTSAALRDMSVRFPEKAKALTDAADSYTSGQKRDLIGASASALGALAAGENDIAIQTLQDRATALEGSGIDTSHTKAAIKMIQDGNVTGAKAYISYVMAGLVGGDHAAGLMDSLGIGGRAEDRRADNDRAAATAAETARHNRVVEGQGAERVGLSRAAGARAAAKGSSSGKGGGKVPKLPTGFVLD